MVDPDDSIMGKRVNNGGIPLEESTIVEEPRIPSDAHCEPRRKRHRTERRPAGIEPAEALVASVIDDDDTRTGDHEAHAIRQVAGASALSAEAADRTSVAIEQVEAFVLIVEVDKRVTGEHA